ncbi:MAG: Uncharacterized protein XD58_0006 [Thermotoga sp. 50_1627]|nr:MAG: Uncharacterized protein XD45_1747 [Thermotoga sp. 50_64]KUK25845.1 MAG: Uncharacterized protein XD58_0006 [Thermotoga sp. 50_1627]
MRKLLVLLVALVTVAAFAAVSISGSAWAKLQVEFDATTATATPTITSGGSVRLVLSDNEGEETGFSVTFDGFGVSSAYVWEYLYNTDALKIKYRLGTLDRGTYYVTNDGGAFALDFAMASGDLSDDLSVFVYFPGEPMVDMDVFNSLSFTFISLDVFAKGLLSAGAGSFPLLGVDATIDLAKALNIENATLEGYACLAIDPNQTGLDMLPNYMFGVDFGIDKFSGGLWFEGPDTIGASVETTVLEPVTIGGSVELPVTLSDFSAVSIEAYAKWTRELLSHKISLSFQRPVATVAWTVSVSF